MENKNKTLSDCIIGDEIQVKYVKEAVKELMDRNNSQIKYMKPHLSKMSKLFLISLIMEMPEIFNQDIKKIFGEELIENEK